MSSSRPSLAKGFIVELDGLRGLAILLVMVHRFWPRTGVGVAADVAGAGWIGVDLFFVISGFLIAGILLDTRGEAGYFRNFYARRALRIFPLYYLFVIGVFVAFAGNPSFREGAGSPLWYLFHLGNVPEGLHGNPVPYWLAPTWSLAIEEQFYLTFPLLVYFLDRRKLTIALVAMIVAAPLIRIATMTAMPDHERVQYLFTLCRIDTIAVGCLLAVLVRAVDVERWRTRAMAVAFCAVPGVVVLAVASGLDRTSPFDRVFGYSLVAVGCASVVALVVLARGHRSTAPLRWAPITYFGKLCFGLYLLHRPADTIVSAAAARVGFDRHLWLMPVKILVAVALATISWRLIEQPFMRLKDRFSSARHPSAAAVATTPARGQPLLRRPTFVTRVLRMIGILIVLTSCNPSTGSVGGDDQATDAGNDGSSTTDGALDDASVPEPNAAVLYVEGSRHSPITPTIVARLQAIQATSVQDARVFAKVGDSITVADAFLRCFDGGTVELGAHSGLGSTISHFMAGNAAGSSPFARSSFAAQGGTTAQDALAGAPCPLDRELDAIAPRIAITMFGTNEARHDWSLDAFGTQLWTLVDREIARGVVPILSTIPANVGYPAADARIPTFNRVIRAIAQGRGVPLVDLHRELAPLPNHGLSSDGLHPSVAPGGGCVLTADGLQYGYNVRNLITLEALARLNAALAGAAADATAPTRSGTGRANDPFRGSLPVVDLADTITGEALVATAPCGAPTSGHEVIYRFDLASTLSIDVFVIDRPGVDVDVRVLAGSTCIAAGDSGATATVGPGAIDIVVDARTTASDGEFVLVVQPR
ncbi:MAG TPA: acyltransferase family protein [Kofleriaceae bacterium]